MTAKGAASLRVMSANAKLSRVRLVPTTTRPRPVPQPPFVASTNVSIDATCSDVCAWKHAGCYVKSGFTKFAAEARDAAAHGHSAEEVIAEEVRLVDRAFGGQAVPQDGARGGRDLRLHVAGDVGSAAGARMLAGAAHRWRNRGGGTVWTYTHAWRDIPRAAWGRDLTVLASVERPEDIGTARRRGYASAIVVARFPSTRRFSLPGSSARIIPCPAETSDKTCVECRLCLDRDLLGLNAAIAFEVHGPTAKKAKEALVQLRRRDRPSHQTETRTQM